VLKERRPDTGLLLARYRYGNRLISLDTGADKRFYHTDGLGSTIGLTDLAGQVDTSYLLDPWGRVLEQTGDSLNRQIFTGQEHDEKTGLIYFGARYYDPDTARFTTRDSYLGEIGTPPSLHRYLYAYGNPTVYVDPNGNIALLRDGADMLAGFNDWLRGRSEMYEDDLLGWFGAVTTGTARGLIGMTEFGLRGVNYAANWGSVTMETPWAQSHAEELMATHDTALSVGRYIAFEGGASRLLGQGADTLGRAARGDASAIGSLTEFVSGSVTGGTAALNVGRVGAATARTAVRTSAVVFQRSVQVVQKTVPVVTREIRSGMKSLGRGVIQGNGGRLNPLNYKVEGLGSNLGNLKYAGPRGGRSWNFVDEVTEDLIILESWEAIRAARLAPKGGTRESIINGLADVVEPQLDAIRKIDPNARVGFRGSLASGIKRAKNGNPARPFDPSDFDVDMFIVSDMLRKGRGFQVGPKPVRNIAKDIDKRLRQLPGFEGLRGGKDKLQFRIWGSEELQKKALKGDSQIFFIGRK